MNGSFFQNHKRELIAFCLGVILAVIFLMSPALHHILNRIDDLGYPGMFVAGMMYGSGLTASLATIVFIDTPPGLNPIVVALLGGLGSAIYDLTIFLIMRREAEHGWLASVINRVRQRRFVPSWVTMVIGTLILISPLPDELAAGLFGVNHGRAKPFFFYSFASNTFGVLLLSGVL